MPIVVFIASITTVFAICTATAFLVVFIDKPEIIGGVGSFLGGTATGIAFLWLLVSTWINTSELSLQRAELEMQRRVLEKTANSTFYQFFVGNRTVFDEILESLSKQILELIDLGAAENGATNLNKLASHEDLIEKISTEIEKDSIGLLRSSLERFSETVDLYFNLLSEAVPGERTKKLETLMKQENRAVQLADIFKTVLDDKFHDL